MLQTRTDRLRWQNHFAPTPSKQEAQQKCLVGTCEENTRLVGPKDVDPTRTSGEIKVVTSYKQIWKFMQLLLLILEGLAKYYMA